MSFPHRLGAAGHADRGARHRAEAGHDAAGPRGAAAAAAWARRPRPLTSAGLTD